MATKVGELVEVTRSYTRKINLGNYESADFFCSQKLECRAEDTLKASTEAHKFCMNEVLRDVAAYKAMRRRQQEKMDAERPHP